jgi:hypothetical protein
MNCDKVKSLLHWFYDGELDDRERGQVSQHVERCPECAAELAALKEWDRVDVRPALVEPPADLWERIAGRLAQGEVRSRQRIVSRRRMLWAAGVLVAIGMGGLLSYGRGRRGRTTDIATQTPAAPDQADLILINMALLSPEERGLVERQKICAAQQCTERLGADGHLVKLVLQDEPVFCCCPECAQWAKTHPAQTLAKVHTLELRHPKPGAR